jgi:hypothetical protein
MTNITVVTGYGYLTDSSGHIVAKSQLSPGVHPLSNGYAYHEVANQAALDAVQVYVAPLSAVDAFSVDQFVADLLTAFASDSNVYQYYAILKDLAGAKNFAAMKVIVNGLLSASKVTQSEVNGLNSVLRNQGIILSNF